MTDNSWEKKNNYYWRALITSHAETFPRLCGDKRLFVAFSSAKRFVIQFPRLQAHDLSGFFTVQFHLVVVRGIDYSVCPKIRRGDGLELLSRSSVMIRHQSFRNFCGSPDCGKGTRLPLPAVILEYFVDRQRHALPHLSLSLSRFANATI